jgi:outer membrane autotransporter protein
MRKVVPAVVVSISLMTTTGWAQVSPAPLVTTAATPPQQGAALVIAPPGGLCRRLVTEFSTATGGVGDLRDRCAELVGNANAGTATNAVQNGLEQMAGVQQTALVTNRVKRALQLTNITSRLAELRGRGFRVGALGDDSDDAKAASLMANLAGTQLAATDATVASSSPSPERLGFFLTGSYTWGDVDGTSREAGFDFSGGGVTAGVDYRIIPNLILGAAFGYTGTSADFDQSGGSVDVDDFAGSLYGTYFVTDQFTLDGIATVGFTDYSLSRRIAYSIPTVPTVGTGITTVNQTAKADPNGVYFAVTVNGSYDFRFGGFTVSPLAGINYLRNEVDGYTEHISGTGPGSGLALRTDDQTIDSFVSSLGVQGTYAVSTPIGVLLPQVAFQWLHEFLDDARTIKSHFVNDPSPSSATTIQWKTDDPDRDFFNVGAGVSMTFPHGIAAYVFYETILGLSGVTEQRVSGGVRVTF